MLFDIKARKYEIIDGQLYVEFIPYNDELKDLLYNGGTYDILNNSIEYTVNYHKPTIRDELYNLLPENIKSGYTNSQFKINDSIENPSKIDYDILGLNKKRTIIKGELRQVEYYKNYIASSNTYSDLVVSEFRDYTRNEIGIVQYRNQTSNWILSDGTTGLTENFTKYYTQEEGIQEGLDRRNNMIGFAKTSLLDGLKVIYGEPANQSYAFDMLTSVRAQMDYFVQGYTQPLRDAVSASTKAYLTVGIKEAIIEQLTF
jgi:hypothetical protein